MSPAARRTGDDPDAVFRIAINGIHAKSGGGVTYLRRMLPELAAAPDTEIHLILHEDQKPLFEPFPDGITINAFGFKSGFFATLVWEQFSLPGIARRMGVDVLFSPANFGPIFARRHVVLLRNATSVIRLTRRLKPLIYWLMLSAATLASLLTARRAIAVSDYASRVLTYGFRGILGRKVVVIPHGTAPIDASRTGAEPCGNNLLAVSDIYIQKNYHTLIRAFAIVRGRYPELTLTIVGREIDTQYARTIRDLVAELQLQEAVVFFGHVETRELAAFYRDCRAFVFPSTVETFGNPLLEAMAAGVPVATSNAAAMPEVLGDCGLLFDPDNADDMASTIMRLLEDPDLCRELGRKAASRAKSFTWAETARRTLNVLREAAD
jgi:glycosyltransferase involved in cell wall biosynthesis